eukprot:TRINITY_DN14226_c0_g1_i1.p1 TRINITY_DN14226_c0_g1~~TRINITY_DN14226_c0_g1_i1.p1  ORF type:complete len:134 (-),score=16.92 TRINITY_DN14226_c0_g1_i1:179-529(-)
MTVECGGNAAGEYYPLTFVFKGKRFGPRNVVVPPPHKKLVTLKAVVTQSAWLNILQESFVNCIKTNEPHLLLSDAWKCHWGSQQAYYLKSKAVHHLKIPEVPQTRCSQWMLESIIH